MHYSGHIFVFSTWIVNSPTTCTWYAGVVELNRVLEGGHASFMYTQGKEGGVSRDFRQGWELAAYMRAN